MQVVVLVTVVQDGSYHRVTLSFVSLSYNPLGLGLDGFCIGSANVSSQICKQPYHDKIVSILEWENTKKSIFF